MDKIAKFIQEHHRPIAVAMIVLAGIFFLDIIYQVQMHVRWRLWIPASLAADNTTTTAPAATPPGRPPELHASIRKRNIFMEPQPRGHGVTLTGVMGTFALFTGRSGPFSLEEGKSANGITVKAIKDYEVTIEYQGKPEVMKLFTGTPAPGPVAPAPAGPSARPALPNQPTSPATSKPAGQPTLNSKERHSSIDLNRDTRPCTTAPH